MSTPDTGHTLDESQLPRARRTGIYHGVGVYSDYLAPALRFARSCVARGPRWCDHDYPGGTGTPQEHCNFLRARAHRLIP
jgi:hypothetical protein